MSMTWIPASGPAGAAGSGICDLARAARGDLPAVVRAPQLDVDNLLPVVVPQPGDASLVVGDITHVVEPPVLHIDRPDERSLAHPVRHHVNQPGAPLQADVVSPGQAERV